MLEEQRRLVIRVESTTHARMRLVPSPSGGVIRRARTGAERRCDELACLRIRDEPGPGEYRIHRLDIATDTWVDTGTFVDERAGSRQDVLLDGGKLYMASRFDGTLPQRQDADLRIRSARLAR